MLAMQSLTVPSLRGWRSTTFNKTTTCTSSTTTTIAIDDRQDGEIGEIPSLGPRPCLQRRNANMPPFKRKTSITPPIAPRIIHQFASYPYLNSNKLLISGFIHQLMDDSSLQSSIYAVSFMKNLCSTYYYIAEDGYD